MNPKIKAKYKIYGSYRHVNKIIGKRMRTKRKRKTWRLRVSLNFEVNQALESQN